MLSPGRELFEKCREDFAAQTGQELFGEGWDGLPPGVRAAWESHAHEQLEKERKDREEA